MENADTNRLELAEGLARRVHSGQVDKSGAPYVDHCRRVAAKLTDESAKVVAWLHDVLEDTDTSEAQLRSEFSDAVVDAVVALTRIGGEAPEEYYSRVRANELALQVKLADIADNLDPERLAVLETATATRLMQKYDKALKELTGE